MTSTKKIDMTKKGYTVFSLRVASELCNRGFRCIDVKPNRKMPWVNVFYFERSKELLKAIEAIK